MIILNLIYSTSFKRPKLDPAFNKQTLSSNRNLISLLPYNNSIFFLFSPPIAWSLLIQNIFVASSIRHCQAYSQTFCPSLSINSQDLLPACQFATYQRLEEEQDEGPRTDDKKEDDFLKIVVNEIFFLEDISDGSGLEIDTKSEDENDDCKDKEPSSSMIAAQKLLLIDFGIIIKAQNKLIKILKRKALISKQRLNLYKIFATLTYY